MQDLSHPRFSGVCPSANDVIIYHAENCNLGVTVENTGVLKQARVWRKRGGEVGDHLTTVKPWFRFTRLQARSSMRAGIHNGLVFLPYPSQNGVSRLVRDQDK